MAVKIMAVKIMAVWIISSECMEILSQVFIMGVCCSEADVDNVVIDL